MKTALIQINKKQYLDVNTLSEQDIYFGLIPEMRQFCKCKGWGCIFCCSNASEHRGKQGSYS